MAALAVLALLAGALLGELQTSALQSHLLARLGRELSYPVKADAGPILQAPDGPYDARAGYSRMAAFAERLRARGFTVAEAAHPSPHMVSLAQRGIFPAYPEKDRTGLTLTDAAGRAVHSAGYPERVYAHFEDVPPLLVDSLLFIEDKAMLDSGLRRRNPAVQWGRFSRAVAGQVLEMIDEDQDGAGGGSTLATQLEKYRHSPEGRTGTRVEKLRQMASASVRAYLDGPDTLAAQRRIVLAYVNTVPLSARPGFGEVNGIGDGLWAWYGRDFEATNRLLMRPARGETAARASAYKAALSLMIAQRRPSYYLAGSGAALATLTDRYLRLLAEAGVISSELRDAALAAPLERAGEPRPATAGSFVDRKAATALRTHLAEHLGVPRFYDLDRLDLSARSTLDGAAQRAVTAVLRALKNPEYAREAGLDGQRMLGGGDDPGKVIYSFTLYERGEGANLLRVQADNYDQPFDINEGARLDLGSTAKLRTLVTYLEIFADLHALYGGLRADELANLPASDDPLTRWTIDTLRRSEDRSLRALLEAAMDRGYSASPAERFYTGGGLHSFANFNRDHDHRVVAVREALRHSINLVFIRMMRDIVRHYIHKNPAADPAIIDDPNDPRRQYYLARFADREGRTFLAAFYRKYRNKSADEALAALLRTAGRSPRRAAVALRSVAPELDEAAFTETLLTHLEDRERLNPDALHALYTRFGPDSYNLPDRGFLARVHPLELWLVGYLRSHPGASLADTLAASQAQRQEVYAWLFRTRHKNAQDVRIRNLLEVEAFIGIGQAWRRLGYPFETLTPSYATSIGSSGDRPAALAELMGVIVNGGMRYPAARFEELHFAAGTPYEMRFERPRAAGERVLAPEVAAVAREALVDVVENGTARRLRGAFVRADGSPIAAGGKTGTGDHRAESRDRSGRKTGERVISRSATFVFLIGERFFGTITAYVGEPYAGDYVFTSALAVQLLRALAPALMPLVEGVETLPASDGANASRSRTGSPS